MDKNIPGWEELMQEESQKEYFQKLMHYLEVEYLTQTVYPPKADVFNAMKKTPLKDVKVLILGQDPYHEPGEANGYSFSVQEGTKIPPSLQNIFKEIHNDIGCEIPKSGDLRGWAKQGVLLLNTVLTTRKHVAFIHRGKGWEQFTDAVIKKIDERCSPTVYMLWGNAAQEKERLLQSKNRLVLKAPHPSPLAVYRGFYGCKHFSKCNEYLKANGLNPVRWDLTDEKTL